MTTLAHPAPPHECQALFMPGLMSYITAVRANNSGAAGSCMFFLCFGLSAVSISVSVPASIAIGMSLFFVILSGLAAAAVVWR